MSSSHAETHSAYSESSKILDERFNKDGAEIKILKKAWEGKKSLFCSSNKESECVSQWLYYTVEALSVHLFPTPDTVTAR